MRIRAALSLGVSLALLAPLPAVAHPHEFVDISVTFHFDDENRLGALGVVWVWDDFTSMLMLEDYGMDADGDGVLSDEERARLVAIFSAWPEDFEGDIYLTRQGKAVELSGPLDLEADYREGRVVVSFLRALPERIDMTGEAILMQAYDPSYYVSYDLAGVPKLRGGKDCEIVIDKADITAAQKIYERVLGQLTEEEILEQGKVPEVGGAFADEVHLTCAA